MNPRLRDRPSKADIVPRRATGASIITAVLFAARKSWKPGVRKASAATYPATPNKRGRVASMSRPARITNRPTISAR